MCVIFPVKIVFLEKSGQLPLLFRSLVLYVEIPFVQEMLFLYAAHFDPLNIKMMFTWEFLLWLSSSEPN